MGELIGMIGREDGVMLAVLGEGVLTRARMRALVLGVLFFLLSQVSQRMGLRILHYFKNDVWFYGK